jgi:tetratricopeptide (TPR) repeat protein
VIPLRAPCSSVPSPSRSPGGARVFFLLACAAGLAASACKARATADDTARVTSAPVAPDASKPADGPADEARRLALAPSNGSGDVDHEIERFQAAAKKLGDHKEDPWIALGQAWVKKARWEGDPGFYVNADAAATVALDVAPGSKLGNDLRALVLLNDHKFEDARALEAKVLEGDPDDAQALGSLSDALLELGRFDEAAAATQKMVDLKPNLPSYARASWFRWLQGDDKAAKAFIRRAIDAGAVTGDVEPRAWVLVQAAMIFWNEGDYDGADAGFDQALAQKTEYPAALVGKGRVAMARGDGAKAAEYLQRAYAQSPLVETAWLLGDARAMAGDAKGASDAWALVASRGRASDPRTLSLFWSTRNEHAEDALALAQAEHAKRGDVYTDDALAWALHRSGRDKEAREAIDRATRLGTRDAKLWFHAGAIRLALGDKTGAKRVADALALSPKFDPDGAREAQQLLDAAKRK